MRRFWPIDPQLWREMAHSIELAETRDDSPVGLCDGPYVDGLFSKQSGSHCQYRYPSPRRSGISRSRPTPPFARKVDAFCRSRERDEKTLVLMDESADSARHKINQNKGSTLCLNSVSSSRLRPSRRFPHVSTTTLNVALQVQLQGPLSRTPLVEMRSPAPSQAALLALCATNSRPSAAKATLGHSDPTLTSHEAPVPVQGSGVFAARVVAQSLTHNARGGTARTGTSRWGGFAI